MITFGVWRWNDTKGGMRFAFPPYGPERTMIGDKATYGGIGLSNQAIQSIKNE
jgi:hypothetical protein